MTSTRYRTLEWDSNFFGISIARCDPASPSDVDEAMSKAREQGVKCVYLLVDGDDTATLHHVMKEPLATQVDMRLTMRHVQKQAFARAESAPVELATPDDLEWLAPLAREAHVQSRFFADWRFPVERAEALYETWIERSIEGWAARVFTARRDGEALGYVTAHLDEEKVGSIGLVAMSASARGQGLGSRLLGQALRWFEAQDAARIEVVTQGRNIAAQRLYQAHGFRSVKAELWYHVWL